MADDNYTPPLPKADDASYSEAVMWKDTNERPNPPHQAMVREFHETFGLTINDRPTVPTAKDINLRNALIREELEELEQANVEQSNQQHTEESYLVDVADALGDILYVVHGAAVTYGIDLDAVFQEIHRSNMSKLWTEDEVLRETGATIDAIEHLDEFELGGTLFRYVGGTNARGWLVKRADGKVMKSPSYSPANLAHALGRRDWEEK